uniref:Uncharacterized protein n=1 Tax=Callorhinchus milii TaxID=7868 RepID=A0A4W3H1G6_CALMI
MAAVGRTVAGTGSRAVKPFLSRDISEAKRRARELYRAWYREIPNTGIGGRGHRGHSAAGGGLAARGPQLARGVTFGRNYQYIQSNDLISCGDLRDHVATTTTTAMTSVNRLSRGTEIPKCWTDRVTDPGWGRGGGGEAKGLWDGVLEWGQSGRSQPPIVGRARRGM